MLKFIEQNIWYDFFFYFNCISSNRAIGEHVSFQTDNSTIKGHCTILKINHGAEAKITNFLSYSEFSS